MAASTCELTPETIYIATDRLAGIVRQGDVWSPIYPGPTSLRGELILTSVKQHGDLTGGKLGSFGCLGRGSLRRAHESPEALETFVDGRAWLVADSRTVSVGGNRVLTKGPGLVAAKWRRE